MLNKDKRSLILAMVLGDGCLHYIKNNNKIYGGLTVDHGIEQADYVAWKAQIVSYIVGRDVKVRTGHKGKSIQFSVCWKRLKAWRKFCYPNGKKSLNHILPFITHPEMALAIWLMDDGYVETSGDRKKKTITSARFRIFTESQPIQDHDKFVKWFEKHLGVTPMIKTYKCSRRNKVMPYLKFNEKDTLKIWGNIRETVLQLKSMRHKFRYVEHVYQNKVPQRIPATQPMI